MNFTQDEIAEIIIQAKSRAFLFFQNNDYANAEELYRQILRIDSKDDESLEMCSLAMIRNGNKQESKKFALQAQKIKPNDFKVYNNLGLIYSALKEHKKAIACFQHAKKINPDESFLYSNLALELKKLGDIEKSLKGFEDALSIFPANEHLYFNYAATLHELGHLEKAVETYKKALEINNQFAACHYNLSACYFLLGDYLKGWDEYEWRWQQFSDFCKVKNRFQKPYWNGEDISGKTLLLYNEQGIGDALMFCRYIKTLQGMNINVILECIAPLHNLLSSLTTIYDGNMEFDFHCSLLSLPRIFKTTPENIPYTNQYLSSTLSINKDSWNKYESYKKVGICWAGSPLHPNNYNRSCMLKEFDVCQLTNIKFFSLQKFVDSHYCTEINDIIDWTKGSNIALIDMRHHMNDFNCTASIISNLDLIITVDTSIAHLSAALGKETWTLLPFMPDWRWGLTGSKTPWYDKMLLFRQKNPGNWKGVFQEIKNHLTQFFPLA